MMNLRQLVVFSILMENNDGILGKNRNYIFEKFELCRGFNIPERILDNKNMAKFNAYAERWKLNWRSARDYWEVPMDQFDPVTGEALVEKVK